MAVEDLFAGEHDLDRPAELEGHLGGDDLVVERIALAAEAAAVGAGDDPDSRRRQAEDLGQGAVHVVRRLGGGVDRHPVDVLGHRHRGVLLHCQVGVALVEEGVLEQFRSASRTRRRRGRTRARRVCGRCRRSAVVVNARLGRRERLLDAGDRLERLVLDLDRSSAAS